MIDTYTLNSMLLKINAGMKTREQLALPHPYCP
jgi:hypothetical protein